MISIKDYVLNNVSCFFKDTICATHVVRTARRDSTDPRALSCRSVTVAIPTPIRRIPRESWMLLLKISNELKLIGNYAANKRQGNR